MTLTDWPREKLIAVRESLGWIPLPWQAPPPKPVRWWAWLLIGGRWSGKTDAGANLTDRHAKGPACLEGEVPHRMGLIGPTRQAVASVQITGETGILKVNPEIRFVPGGKVADLIWPNGAVADIYGAYTREDAERFRGPAHCWLWGDEVAAWRYLEEVWDNMRLGLRLGPLPQFFGGTTPRPRKFLVHQLDDPQVVHTRASTMDNPYAPQEIKDEFYRQYGGTRLGRQELEAEFLLDVPGALWEWEWIERNREEKAPDLSAVVVSIDPAVTHAETSDLTGIVAVGKGYEGDYWVLDDRSLRAKPLGWAEEAIRLLDRVGGVILVEDNQGGDMVESTLRQVRRDIPVQRIKSSQSKELRAQPVALLTQQGRLHLVGTYPELEDQMTSFGSLESPPEYDDRVDAMVHGVRYLMGKQQSGWGAA